MGLGRKSASSRSTKERERRKYTKSNILEKFKPQELWKTQIKMERRKEELGLLLLSNNIYIVAKVFRESPLS